MHGQNPIKFVIKVNLTHYHLNYSLREINKKNKNCNEYSIAHSKDSISTIILHQFITF